MECPRCGFEQPPDMYCANCGVHMERFGAKKAQRRTRLMLAGGGVLVAALLGGAAWLLGGGPPPPPETASVDNAPMAAATPPDPPPEPPADRAPPPEPAPPPPPAGIPQPPAVDAPPPETVPEEPAQTLRVGTSEPPSARRIIVPLAAVLRTPIGDDEVVYVMAYHGGSLEPVTVTRRTGAQIVTSAGAPGDFLPDGFVIAGVRDGAEVEVSDGDGDVAGYLYVLLPEYDEAGAEYGVRLQPELSPGEPGVTLDQLLPAELPIVDGGPDPGD